MLRRITRGMSLGLAVTVISLNAFTAEAGDPKQNAADIKELKGQLAQITQTLEVIAHTQQQLAARQLAPIQQVAAAEPARLPAGQAQQIQQVAAALMHPPVPPGQQLGAELGEILAEYDRAESRRRLACALKELLKCADNCASPNCGGNDCDHSHKPTSYRPVTLDYCPTGYTTKWYYK